MSRTRCIAFMWLKTITQRVLLRTKIKYSLYCIYATNLLGRLTTTRYTKLNYALLTATRYTKLNYALLITTRYTKLNYCSIF